MSGRPAATFKFKFAAFIAVNLAFGPLAAILSFKPQIAVAFGVTPGAITLIYGLYFVAGGVAGRWIALRGISPRFDVGTIVAALMLATGALSCAWLTTTFGWFLGSFVVISGVLGGTWFLSPFTSHVLQRAGTRPATGVAIATVGQLTALGFWKAVFAVMGVIDWRSAMTIAALATVAAIPPLALAMDVSAPSLPIPPLKRFTPAPRHSLRLLTVGFGLTAFGGTSLILGLGSPAGSGLAEYRYEAFSIAAIVGRLLAAMCFDRGWRASSILTCSMLVAVPAVGGPVSDSGEWLLACAVCLGLGYGGILPIAVNYARSMSSMQAERVTANVFHASCIGIGSGASLPLVATYGPISAGPVGVALAAVASLTIWIYILARRVW